MAFLLTQNIGSERKPKMNYTGLIVGAMSFIIIGIFHPIVIKCEYYFTEKVWPVFLVGGLAVCALSVFIKDQTLSAVLAVLGFSMLWSIGELKHQTMRVEKGWFPKNPKREQKKDNGPSDK